MKKIIALILFSMLVGCQSVPQKVNPLPKSNLPKKNVPENPKPVVKKPAVAIKPAIIETAAPNPMIPAEPVVESSPISQPQQSLPKKSVEPSTTKLPEELEPFLLEQQPDVPNEEVTVTPLPVTPALPPKVRTPTTSIEFVGLPPAMVQLLMQADKEKKQRNYVAASVSVERALRIQPKSAVAYKRLAEIHLAQGRYAEAEQWARKAVQYANFSPYTRTLQFRNSVNALLLRAQSGR